MRILFLSLLTLISNYMMFKMQEKSNYTRCTDLMFAGSGSKSGSLNIDPWWTAATFVSESVNFQGVQISYCNNNKIKVIRSAGVGGEASEFLWDTVNHFISAKLNSTLIIHDIHSLQTIANSVILFW
jgi:hypothetical protein